MIAWITDEIAKKRKLAVASQPVSIQPDALSLWIEFISEKNTIETVKNLVILNGWKAKNRTKYDLTLNEAKKKSLELLNHSSIDTDLVKSAIMIKLISNRGINIMDQLSHWSELLINLKYKDRINGTAQIIARTIADQCAKYLLTNLSRHYHEINYITWEPESFPSNLFLSKNK